MVDCCSAPGLMPLSEALSHMLSSVEPITDILQLNVEEGLDFVLAENVSSPINVPNDDNSAMDGYAFAYKSLDAGQSLKLAGKSMAGAPFSGACNDGECIRIMTGAAMPKGCDTVEMQENCSLEGDSMITFNQSTQQGRHVRYAGDDINKGDLVFTKGRRLSAVDLGVLASLGVVKVKVYRQLKVALIATGDELKGPGETLSQGDIYETNSTVLAAMLKKLNIHVDNFGVIEDDPAKIKAAFVKANKIADVVISSGGVSVGDADYTKEVLDELGDIGFWKVAIKPGKPVAFGRLSESIFFGLPGNPVSATVTADILAVPVLRAMQNSTNEQPVEFPAICQVALKKSPGRTDFQRGIMSVNEQGELTVTSTGKQGSGILTSVAKANCYIVLASEQGSVSAGERVTIRPFPAYLR